LPILELRCDSRITAKHVNIKVVHADNAAAREIHNSTKDSSESGERGGRYTEKIAMRFLLKKTITPMTSIEILAREITKSMGENDKQLCM